jgi:hypothetical protein
MAVLSCNDRRDAFRIATLGGGRWLGWGWGWYVYHGGVNLMLLGRSWAYQIWSDDCSYQRVRGDELRSPDFQLATVSGCQKQSRCYEILLVIAISWPTSPEISYGKSPFINFDFSVGIYRSQFYSYHHILLNPKSVSDWRHIVCVCVCFSAFWFTKFY